MDTNALIGGALFSQIYCIRGCRHMIGLDIQILMLFEVIVSRELQSFDHQKIITDRTIIVDVQKQPDYFQTE